ncbi:ionic transporter y4hA [Alpinimonas psychrophila]|uniref:Ca2+:H+ antiporter n=1 Tax=Alpinimonas psychrophila TaxID=748908 RepID=A0A7W3JT43_9MICO|nr:ionic transporter y4hA [Alpinimonas psychrophila]MBA8828764.1 Ca2+:H+ antiporter [Alpinimonas psychrophila]
MSKTFELIISRSFLALPVVALIALALSWGRSLPDAILAVLGLVLAASIIAAVHHAEVVAHRVGEPFGSLILALAVTIIEVGMIVTLMLSSPDSSSELARDTVFAAVMITCNGIVGIAIVIKALRKRVATFKSEGVGGALATIAVIATLSLVLPTFTTSTAGPTFSATQLTYAAAASLGLYLLFVFVQTYRHRDFFLPPMLPKSESTKAESSNGESVKKAHAASPSRRTAIISLALLTISLVGVVGLAKVTSPLIESAVSDLGLPQVVVAVSIALLVLAPEAVSAIRAAYLGRTQKSLNLAYGSAMASIGLTIPVIAVLSLVFGFNVALGLGGKEIVLLAVTLIVSTLTVVPGRATVLQGGVHLALFGAFLVLAVSP